MYKRQGTEFTSGFLTTNDYISDEDLRGRKSQGRGCPQFVDLYWDWGFTIGIGCNLPCKEWDISLNYTDFDTKGHETVCTKKANEYITNYKTFAFNSYLRGLTPSTDKVNLTFQEWLSKKVNSKFCINLQALKFDLGKSFCVCECITLCPKIGFEVSWITLKQNTRYIYVQPFVLIMSLIKKDDRLAGVFFDYSIKDCSKFSGVGPHFGFESQWHFFDNIYLYGNISGALVYGLFTTSHKEKMFIDLPVEIPPEIEYLLLYNNCICQRRHAFVPLVNTQIGIAYNTSFYCDQMQLTLKLAFDAQYIWRINQILETRNITTNYVRISEDMSIHGVTFDIRFDF